MCNKFLSLVGATVVMTVLLVIALPGSGHTGKVSIVPILDKLPPVWSQKIPGQQRFEVVLDGEAALDKETGLVWELSPNHGTPVWEQANIVCYDAEIGGRKGWHLPTIEQLMSIIDKSGDEFNLPAGHPFDVISGQYWTATPSHWDRDNAYYVDFGTGNLGLNYKVSGFLVWCVRGGQSNATR